jgi:multiple sugar transport system substrate-binding protein
LTGFYKEGFIPPGVLNWNDNDDNNAFHAKLVVMDFDGTISNEVALWDDKAEYDEILTLGLPLSNEGKQLPSIIGTAVAVVPKGAKNVAAAKEFLKFSIEPKVLAAYLKTGLGRFLPPMPSIVENDKAFWLDPKNEPLEAYTRQGVLGPTIPPYEVFNPAWAQISTDHVFALAMIDVMNNGMTPEAAIDKALSAARRSSRTTRSSRPEQPIYRRRSGLQRPSRLPSMSRMTVPMAIVQFLNGNELPRHYMIVTATRYRRS